MPFRLQHISSQDAGTKARQHDSTTARKPHQTINHQSSTINHQSIKPSTINHQSSTINHQSIKPPTINHQTSNIKHQTSLSSSLARGSGRHFHVI